MQSTRFVEDKAFKKRAPAENNVLAEVGLARCCRSWMFVPRSFTDASWTSLQVAWAAERGRLKVLSFGLDLGQNAARSRVHESSVVGIAGLHGRLLRHILWAQHRPNNVRQQQAHRLFLGPCHLSNAFSAVVEILRRFDNAARCAGELMRGAQIPRIQASRLAGHLSKGL